MLEMENLSEEQRAGDGHRRVCHIHRVCAAGETILLVVTIGAHTLLRQLFGRGTLWSFFGREAG
jgi:hypothetical protein